MKKSFLYIFYIKTYGNHVEIVIIKAIDIHTHLSTGRAWKVRKCNYGTQLQAIEDNYCGYHLKFEKRYV